MIEMSYFDHIYSVFLSLKASQAKEDCALRSLERLSDYERQVKILKEEIAVLGAQNSVLQSRWGLTSAILLFFQKSKYCSSTKKVHKVVYIRNSTRLLGLYISGQNVPYPYTAL